MGEPPNSLAVGDREGRSRESHGRIGGAGPPLSHVAEKNDQRGGEFQEDGAGLFGNEQAELGGKDLRRQKILV